MSKRLNHYLAAYCRTHPTEGARRDTAWRRLCGELLELTEDGRAWDHAAARSKARRLADAVLRHELRGVPTPDAVERVLRGVS